MRLVFSVCAVIVLALAAVACGGSDDNGGGGGILSGNQGAAATTAPGSASSGGASTPASAAPTTPNNASGLNACTLFTKEDAAAAIGKPVKDGVPRTGNEPLNQHLCFYGTVESSGESVQLSVIQTSALSPALKQSGSTAKVQYDLNKNLTNAGAATDVPGVGQGAFIRGTSLYAIKGDTEFSILLLGNGKPGDASHTNALKAAATKVVAKVN